MDNDRIVSYALTGSAATAVGTSFVASSLLLHYPFLGGQAVRYAAAAAALVAAVVLLRLSIPRPTAREWMRLALLAATGLVGFNLAVLSALRFAEPAAVGVVVGCVPVVLAVAAPLRQGRPPSRRLLSASAVVVAGAAVVQGLGHADALGFMYAVGALACEAAFSLLAVPLLPRLGHVAVSMYACGAAAIELAVLAALADGTNALRMPTLEEASALAYLALIVTAAAFACWYAGLRRLGAEQAGLFAGLIPVSAALTAPLVGTGRLRLPQIVGCALVGLGVAFGVSRERRSAIPADWASAGRNRAEAAPGLRVSPTRPEEPEVGGSTGSA